MPEPAGVTFDRGRWLALVAAIGEHPLIAALEAERVAAEFSVEERAIYAAAGDGFGWLYGSEALGWFPRYPGRHTRAGPNGESVERDPPRRSLGTRSDGTPIEVIETPALPHAGVQGLLRRGVIRALEPEGDGIFGVMVALMPAPFPWRVGRAEDDTPLAGAWILDAKGGRVAWVPSATDAHSIVRDADFARATEADVYRIEAMRDSLQRLRQVTHPDDRYQPPAELARLHQDAQQAVDRLLAALPGWVAAGKPVGTSGLPTGLEDPGVARRARFPWMIVLIVGMLAGWLLHGCWGAGTG